MAYSHVRVLSNDDLLAAVRVLPNTEDVVIRENEFGPCEEMFPDQANPVTDTNRSYTIEIHFDTPTDLEASLATSAVAGFVRRRLGLNDAVIIGRTNF